MTLSSSSPSKFPSLGVLSQAVRVRQWLKNGLIFLPLAFAHQLSDLGKWLILMGVFLVWSLGASSVYLVNDLWDIHVDRLHPLKRKRPLAAGLMTSDTARWLAVILFAIGTAGAALISIKILGAYLLYITLTFFYSWKLKRIALLDVFLLASFYMWRLEVGALAVDVDLSSWLIQFSLFFFLSLALLKRYAELRAQQDGRQSGSSARRSYSPEDLRLVQTMGVCFAGLSVVVLALYVTAPETSILYPNPRWLIWVCPCLLYWLIRLWWLAERGEVLEDPVHFAVTDRVSYIVAFLVIVLATFAASSFVVNG